MAEGNQNYQSLSHFNRECKYYVEFIPKKYGKPCLGKPDI